MVEPTSYKDLEALLRERLHEFTPNQRRIAQQLLSDPEGCAFQTVSELAGSVGVNESTVVRFANALGLRGYPQLARLCQQRLREQAQLLERFDALNYLETVDGELLGRTVAYDQANIARTFANVDPDSWQQAVRALSTSRAVGVVGLRKSFAASTLLAYLLRLVRDEVHELGTLPAMLPDGLRRFGPDDVVVGISIHRYARDTVRALEVARAAGATTIALTDNASSPLTPQSDVSFYVDVAGVSLLRSVTAFTSMVQALASAVATELGTHTRSALLLEEKLLADFDVYHDGPSRSGGAR
ncbi:MurR/RpiR family transcriptional regulator [Egibacter rhizosphaerae]|uniref:MurR/RpiR family transcriptional regulator n=1 Tax=Egibacter rhizosphaerae TaxID=1670831 RepID=UPI00197ACA98|nr:MurR/RpiR family transcriptional regulator [Egibacter rhizosphaerae]